METTIPSYLLAEPSRDLLGLARQEITRTWWKRDRSRYAIFVSEVVIREAGKGDRKEARKRREFLEQFPVLATTPEMRRLSEFYMEKSVVPIGNAEDAAHLAFASIYQIEFLCTWNFKHLANVLALRRLRQVNEKRGLFVPQVCTPEQLPGE
ncbi:MAG TPA: type II toxin-antitoxin system VapC family toxin [Candidatus Bathyarchaeia archaeon]|nr:type II toxin-antitoxin system VapC family toxin [Candidatus Bathyarchaeia archaeon]